MKQVDWCVRLLLAVAVVTVLALAFPEVSAATFMAGTQSTATVQAAADWTPPTVAVVNPGSAVKGTTTIAVTATDAETGIASVTLEQLAPGASGWVAICTDTTAPYSCAWNTIPLVDGSYSLRARATDNAGYESTAASVRTTVANNLLVVLATPGDAVRGAVPLITTVYNAGQLAPTVRVEYAAADTTNWKAICTGLTSPYACTWNTTTLAAGDYDLRSVLTAGSTSTASAIVQSVTVDNAAPSVTMLDPGTPLSGTKTFSATATDATSGVSQVVIQYSLNGSSSWTDLCRSTEEPWTCQVATSVLPDGAYSFRAVATDVAGNVSTSAATVNRVVDNTISSVTLDVPASLAGTVTVGATASSTAGVASVRIQFAASGTNTWSDLCTDTTSPYACTWDTASVPDGLYDLRAVMVDRQGGTTTSPTVGSQRVDNAPLRGVDVQSTNGGATIGKAESGDTVTFTYSSQIDLGKISAGWNGAATTVTARFRDGAVVGRTATDDTLDVLSAAAAVNLGSVNLRRDYIKSGKSASFTATITAGTVTTSTGVVRTTVTLRLGAVTGSGNSALRTTTATGAMVWTPSAIVTDLQGRPCSTTPVTETGNADGDL